MIETIFPLMEELWRSFRFVDAIDVLLVSAFLYTALLWFQRTASRGILVGVASLAIVYFLSRSLDMYLTSLAFHTSFAVLLFILVVVFQEDLRRLLERVASFRTITVNRTSTLPIEIDSLVEIVFKMAALKTGALIVMKGKEPLGRHLNGGVKLNGKLSAPLLFSIFDSSSPGHDGAVVIDSNGVEQFAVHLPISQNVNQIAGRGTRHSAALGLSEVSDALTIVVSEERGVVSVAETGALDEMKTATALKQRLDDFLGAAFPANQPPLWRSILIQHAGEKVLALTMAIIAWFTLAYDPHTVQRTFIVPIEYRNVAKQLEFETTAPSECRVTLSGSERNFRFLDPATLKVSLDLSGITKGYHELQLSEQSIRLPANLDPYRIEPRVIRVLLNFQQPKPNAAEQAKGTP